VESFSVHQALNVEALLPWRHLGGGGPTAMAAPRLGGNPRNRPAWGALRRDWGGRPPPRHNKEGADLGPMVAVLLSMHAPGTGCSVYRVWAAF
jgi:hypothetical protein